MTTLGAEIVVFKVVLTSLRCDVSTISRLGKMNRCDIMHRIKSSTPELNKCVEKNAMNTNQNHSLVLNVIKSSTTVVGHGIGGKDIPIMARLAKARRWSKR